MITPGKYVCGLKDCDADSADIQVQFRLGDDPTTYIVEVCERHADLFRTGSEHYSIGFTKPAPGSDDTRPEVKPIPAKPKK